MTEKKLSDYLWNALPKKDQHLECILFEQYKLYVEMADRISSRRDTANAFFLTLNSLVLGSSAGIISKGILFEPKWLLVFPFLVLCLQLYFWRRLIISYKQLNGAKFQIIGELEKRLPASPYGQAEWVYLLKGGKDRNVYWPLTHLESKIPWIFLIGYVIALIALISSH